MTIDLWLRCYTFAKWAKRLAKIADDGNAKRAAAAKEQPRDASGKMKTKPVVDHDDPRPAGGKHVARAARAAEAKVSPATMGRAMQLHANKDTLIMFSCLKA